MRQGERFDPEGTDVRRWVPELAHLPTRLIQRPWDAPSEERVPAGSRYANPYPPPVVDLENSRQQALARYADWKHATQ